MSSKTYKNTKGKQQSYGVGQKSGSKNSKSTQQEMKSFYKMIKTMSLQSGPKKKGQKIPFIPAHFMSRTQFPTIRLYFSMTYVTPTAATNYSTVVTIDSTLLQNWSDLTNVFDEARWIGGEFMLFAGNPVAVGSAAPGNGIAVIDYDDNTALTTANAANAYDTKKYFTITSLAASAKLTPQKWPIVIEPLPDQDWFDPATSSGPAFYWKPFIPSAQLTTANTYTFSYTGWMDVQFRNSI